MGFEAIVFLFWTAVAAWVVFLGGADQLEDTVIGDLVLGLPLGWQSDVPAMAIKICVAILWLFGGGLLLLMWSL